MGMGYPTLQPEWMWICLFERARLKGRGRARAAPVSRTAVRRRDQSAHPNARRSDHDTLEEKLRCDRPRFMFHRAARVNRDLPDGSWDRHVGVALPGSD